MLLALASPKDDAAHVAAPVAPRCRHDPLAVEPTRQAFDLPDVRLDSGVLQLVNGIHHEGGPEFQVVDSLVRFDFLKLSRCGRHQKFEHVLRRAVAKVLRQAPQSRRLAKIRSLIARRVVTNQYLAKGRCERVDVMREILPVLEVELVLAALLGGRTGDDTAVSCAAQDVGTEALIDEDAGFLRRYAARDREHETVVDYLLGRRNPRGLLRIQRSGPAEHSALEGGAVIEGKNVQRLCVTANHGGTASAAVVVSSGDANEASEQHRSVGQFIARALLRGEMLCQMVRHGLDVVADRRPGVCARLRMDAAIGDDFHMAVGHLPGWTCLRL